jgi:hypothetical protein
MYFPGICMVSVTAMNTYFRVHNYIIKTWFEEGITTTCVWRNGRRFWSGDDINKLIEGGMIRLPSGKSLEAEGEGQDFYSPCLPA